MGIDYKVLGKLYRDNALYVSLDTGHNVFKFLFDCGEYCLYKIPLSDLQDIDHLLFSHFHMDHIAGFDTFLRCNYNRSEKPVFIWGPQDAFSIIENRLRGYTWNLVYGQPGKWFINEVEEKSFQTHMLETKDAFSTSSDKGITNYNNVLIDHEDYALYTIILNHRIPVLGYLVEEKTKWNVKREVLEQINCKPGPWLNRIKQKEVSSEEIIDIGNEKYTVEKLRTMLLKEKKGEKLVYLTDFLCDEETLEKLKQFIPRDSIIICETQYCEEDKDFAIKNYHLTASQAATIAKETNAKSLTLFHISRRYQGIGVNKHLEEAKQIFPNSSLPKEWKIKIEKR